MECACICERLHKSHHILFLFAQTSAICLILCCYRGETCDCHLRTSTSIEDRPRTAPCGLICRCQRAWLRWCPLDVSGDFFLALFHFWMLSSSPALTAAAGQRGLSGPFDLCLTDGLHESAAPAQIWKVVNDSSKLEHAVLTWTSCQQGSSMLKQH